MRILLTILINSLALYIASQVLDGFHLGAGWLSPILAGFVISVLNLFAKPILKFLSFPFVFLTGGLFLIVVNAVVIFLTEYLLLVMDVQGASMIIDNLLTYLLAAIIFGLSNWLIHWFLKE